MPPVRHLLRKLNGLICILLAGLCRLGKTARRSKSDPRQPVKLALLISRPQDIDLLIDPHIKALQRPDVTTLFWATARAVHHFPDVLSRLSDDDIEPQFVLKHTTLLRAVAALSGIDALVTTVESTLAAHKIPYLLTRVANAAGIQTFTLQHGFENVGLTYTDGTYGPHIRFAAKTVLTWGPVQNIPAAVSDETRRKCVAVGCPKLHLTIPSDERRSAGDRPIIAVFEGLHASRFDDQYIIQFFKDLQEIAQNFPGLHFILKPHPGALVRTPLHAGSLDALRGVDVLDPALPESAYWTTPRLIAHALAVITTPSTIALDATLGQTPAAVVRYGQMIPYYAYYEPLPLIDTRADWQDYLNQVSLDPKYYEPHSKTFLNKLILPGDAADRLLNVVVDRVRRANIN
jgi:hypothetical protein